MKKLVEGFGRFILILFPLIIYSCQSAPVPIEFGADNCSYCKMLITDPKYGAELVTLQGKPIKFDSIECMGEYLLENKNEKNFHSLWVIDFLKTKELINAEKAFYLKNDEFHSPMGLNVLAVEREASVEELVTKYGGEKMNWAELKQLIKSEYE